MLQNMPLKKIDPNPGQPREHFTGLEELADSIKTEGLLEPIMVRPSSKAGKRFQIVHGERRYRASKLAGLADIPAIVREVDDKTMFRLSLVENVQRDALTAMEEAQAYARLQEQGYAQVEIGHIIGKGQSYVAHKLRLLKVPDVLTHYLSVGQLTENHFRQAMRLKNIIGEDISEEWVAIPAEDPRDFRATAMSLLIFRPYGRLVTALPMRPRSRAYVEAEAAVIEGVKRFDEYVSKHTPTPVWHRIAFWWLSAMVGYQWTVVEAGRYIDDYERLIYSQVVWHSSRMGKKDPAGWGSYEWAVYHDLKHAGLMDTVGTGSKLYDRAVVQLGREGLSSVIVPSELQNREPFWEDPLPDKPTDAKTLQELEDSLSRSTDKISGGAVAQAEALRFMYHHPDGWKKRGYSSFGEYVEREHGRPAEAVLRPDGSLRPTRELAMSLDDWGGSTFLADVLCEAAQKMEREKFLEILEPTEDEDVHIPVGAVLTPEGEPYPKVEMVRRIQALEGEE